MSLSPVLCAQLVISVGAVLLNGMGIYCIRHRKKGNRNQLLLQQNLAWVQLVKTVYDYIPWAIYHFNALWYNQNYRYFAILEINMMTLIYGCFGLITLDRFLCVVLKIDYSKHVTSKRMKSVIYTMWTISMTPGVFLWGIFTDIGVAKVYYYLSTDIIITALLITTYTIIIKSIQKRNDELDLKGVGKMKMQIISVLLMVTFIFTNAVPDLIYLVDNHGLLYDVISILWSLGYLLDPIVYIFTAQKMRKIAMTAVLKMLTCGRVKELPLLSWFTSWMTTKKTNVATTKNQHHLGILDNNVFVRSWVPRSADAASMSPERQISQSKNPTQPIKEETITIKIAETDLPPNAFTALSIGEPDVSPKRLASDGNDSNLMVPFNALKLRLCEFHQRTSFLSHKDFTVAEFEFVTLRMSRGRSHTY